MIARGLAVLALAGAIGSAAALEEVPFVTTPDNVTLKMLELARVGPRDFVLDLGSGDGRIVIVAAKRFGARGMGVEIVPELVRQSRENAQRAGVSDRAEFREQDLFETNLAQASVLTLYLLPDVNLELRPKILALKPGTRVVSHDWDMGDWKPDRTEKVAAPDKKIGLEKSSRVHLWIVPARLEGVWCAKGERLEIKQQFQHAHVDGRDATIRGTTLALAQGTSFEFQGDTLRVTTAKGDLARLQLLTFERAPGQPPSCASR